MADMVACPSCTRPNSVHRVTCLYCGASMPSPKPRAAGPEASALPANLDALVREALAGGDIRKLKSAMNESRSTSPSAVPLVADRPAPPRSPPAAPAKASSVRGGRATASVASGTEPPPVVDPLGDALRTIVASARAALAAHHSGRPVHEALQAVQHDLTYALAMSPPPEPALDHTGGVPPAAEEAEPLLIPLPDTPPIPVPVPPVRDRPEVVLPGYRHHWMLVIRGPGEVELAPALAVALSVDVVTARFSAVARNPRVVLRGDDPAPLRRAAVQVQRLGVDATVVSRDSLQGIAAPDLVLGCTESGRFQVSATWPWTGDAPTSLPPDARTLPWSGMKVAVPGEVSVKRYRLGRSLARGRRKEQVLRLGTESRVSVIDLHGPGRFFRLVAGVTDTTGLPAHDPRSGLRSFKGLLEALPELIRGCRVLGSRACTPGDTPRVPEGYDGSHPIEATGWAAWEEHTRMARLLSGLSSGDVPVDRA